MLKSPSSSSETSLLPLVLDLDGTLIQTDTCYEMTFRLLLQKPWLLFHILSWFLKSRPYAKARLADCIELSPQHLPYNSQLLTFAKNEAQKGRPIILATGTDQRVAQKIADHLGLFQDVIGSDGKINMTGPRKQQALLQRFGDQGFDYAGDSHMDLHVWQAARYALVVKPKRGVLKRVLALKGPKYTYCFPT